MSGRRCVMKQKPIDPFFHQSMYYTVIGEDGRMIGEVYVLDRSMLPSRSRNGGRQGDSLYSVRRASSPRTTSRHSSRWVHSDV